MLIKDRRWEPIGEDKRQFPVAEVPSTVRIPAGSGRRMSGRGGDGEGSKPPWGGLPHPDVEDREERREK